MPKKEIIPSTPFAFIWFALESYKKAFFTAVAFVVLAEVCNGFVSLAIKKFIDTAQLYSTGGGSSVTVVLVWLMAFPVLNFLYSMAYRTSGFKMNVVNMGTRASATQSLFSYLSLHGSAYFNDRFSGALSEKAGTVSQNITNLLNQFVWSILNVLTSFLVTSIILFNSNSSLAVIFILGFALLVPFNLWLTRHQSSLSETAAELGSKLKGQLIDTLTNITAVQQYSRRLFEIARLDKIIGEWTASHLKKNNYREWVLTVNTILIGLFLGGIVFWSFVLWTRGFLTVGTLVMIVALTRGFSYSLLFIGQNLNATMEFYGEMKNGLKEIIRPHEIVDKSQAGKLKVEEGSVLFENVTFAYSKDPRKIFDKLSFQVKQGQKVGIVGTSGAGKTTIVKLLLRQHDVLAGHIKIDGQDIRNVTQESLRENISIVPQEPMLFHRTIRENIMYGKPDATEGEMLEVARKAQAHDFIELLPQKYDSLVGERGVKLSVGQRQRIAIARAFLKNAPILVLDEATSALDSESEVAVQKALQTLMEGKTVFAIAHRLSTLREMDRILVFKDGQIVEDGTHRTLLRNKEGVYASFWAHQAGGFIKED